MYIAVLFLFKLLCQCEARVCFGDQYLDLLSSLLLLKTSRESNIKYYGHGHIRVILQNRFFNFLVEMWHTCISTCLHTLVRRKAFVKLHCTFFKKVKRSVLCKTVKQNTHLQIQFPFHITYNFNEYCLGTHYICLY